MRTRSTPAARRRARASTASPGTPSSFQQSSGRRAPVVALPTPTPLAVSGSVCRPRSTSAAPKSGNRVPLAARGTRTATQSAGNARSIPSLPAAHATGTQQVLQAHHRSASPGLASKSTTMALVPPSTSRTPASSSVSMSATATSATYGRARSLSSRTAPALTCLTTTSTAAAGSATSAGSTTTTRTCGTSSSPSSWVAAPLPFASHRFTSPLFRSFAAAFPAGSSLCSSRP
ncbi:uncharacterized protein AMSG_09822 [Thecamonas trahens ATCC 50062]|uniref:Uncharacterized protein n=1 Tax=Thecamonas trahens ATCC 50062 TaxID=461836 RepID=A0A0L0DNM5_THETB|nr:hypothetical protein AMSG_09822 [Thecamonas trahens ATCC 50062]KNC53870.1 hypothetical protein AMSG_09822 [Thecamonas trahens ATCC 50062]|eukprot:XP_013754250.1 hypothetical protein AMSG_09822 [Thecamonas trahens ATCC 50062]